MAIDLASFREMLLKSSKYGLLQVIEQAEEPLHQITNNLNVLMLEANSDDPTLEALIESGEKIDSKLKNLTELDLQGYKNSEEDKAFLSSELNVLSETTNLLRLADPEDELEYEVFLEYAPRVQRAYEEFQIMVVDLSQVLDGASYLNQ